MSTLRACHASGKWSARPDRFARYLKRAARRGAQLITTTESKGMLPAVKKTLGPKWDCCIEGEFIVAVRRDVGRIGPGRLAVFSDQFHGSSDWRDNRTHVRWVRITGVGPLLVVVTHASSAVQHGANWSGFGDGVKSHQATTGRIGALVARRERMVSDVPVICPGDWNVHLGMAIWRRRLTRALNLTCCWDVRPPKRGTHGKERAIDAIFANRRISRPRVGPPGGGVLDHKWVMADVELGASNKPDKPRRRTRDMFEEVSA